MWTASVAIVVVLQLHSVHVMTATVPACGLPGNVVLEAQNLLRDLVGTHLRTLTCVLFFVIWTNMCCCAIVGVQCRQALRALHESLQGAEQVFEDYDVALGEGGLAWDRHMLDDFQNLQNRLLREGGCVSTTTPPPDPGMSAYFGNVSALLQQQESATCGWSVLRRDVLWVLNTALHRHHSCFSW
uniref:Uncharacterized protein n=1 Tax=Hippocampus comes TaxID=109280 RepID=A0A3Q2XC10_HIPCM